MYRILLFTLLFFTFLFADEGFEECGLGQIAETFLAQGIITETRPMLSGTPTTINTANFKIHYTLSGDDATTQAWADAIATYAEEVHSEIVAQGWLAPPQDNGMGGDTKYDIYIHDLEGYNGITQPEDTPAPGSDYTNSYSSWVELRKDPVPNSPVGEQDRLKSLAAHELHHASQLAYSWIPEDVWFYENTATYMEKRIYPIVNLLKYRLQESNDTPIANPELSINENVAFSTYEYAGGLWPLFLDEFYSSPTIVREVWESCGSAGQTDFFSQKEIVLQNNYSSDLTTAKKNYGIWRYFTGSRNDSHHFSDAAEYHTAPLYAEHSDYPVLQNTNPKKMHGPGGVTYIRFNNASGNYLDITFDGEDDLLWKALAMGIMGGEVNLVTEFNLTDDDNGTAQHPSVDEDYVIFMPILNGEGFREDYTYYADISDLYPVQFMNVIADEDAGGQLKLDGSETIESGEWRYYENIEQHNIETLRERFSASNISKHKDWKNSQQEHFLNRDFFTNQREQHASFNSIYMVTVENSFSSASSNGGNLAFHDPWYVDANGQQPDTFLPFDSPYQPTGSYNETSGGVFLDQDFNDPVPYYSVKTAATQTIPFHGEDVLWYFQRWEGTDVEFEDAANTQTALVFKESGAQARAVYKGHLASDKTTPSGLNNGRRIVRENATELHMVYADGYELWYTHSTDNGATWDQEQEVLELTGGPDDNQLNPHLMLFDNTLYLAWTWYIPNPQYNVYVKSKPVNGGTWSSETLVATLNITSSNPAPVLTTFKDNNIDYLLLVVEENDSSTGNPRIRTFYKQDGSSTWTASPHILSGSRPSVDSKSDGSKARIVYQRNGQVYTRRFNLFDKDWGIERHVSQGIYWAVAHGNPVVAFAAGSTAKAHIAWEAESEAGNDPLVYYCTIDDSENLNNYASHYQYNHSYSHPSISYDDNGGFPYIAMVKDGAVIKRKKSGSSWTTETLDNSGRAPNMALNSAGGSVWTKYNSLPYVVKAEVYEDEPMAMASSSSRMVFLLDDGAYLTLDLSGAQMNAGKLDFDPQLNASGSPQGSDDFRFDWQVQFHNAAGLAGNHARLIDIELDGAVIKTLTLDDFIGYNDGAKHSDATLFTYISSLTQRAR